MPLYLISFRSRRNGGSRGYGRPRAQSHRGCSRGPGRGREGATRPTAMKLQRPNEEDEMAAEQHLDPYGDGQKEPLPRPPALRIVNR